jgi:hypothetical protein
MIGLTVGVVVLGGCKSLGQDLNEVGNSLTPTSPSEAARMMIDPHDPDNRRRGTVLISNSPFGGADAYMALYRDRVLSERDPLVLAASITALGRYGEPEDAPPIAVHLEHEQFQVRWEAAKALQRIHHTDVVGDLLRVLRNVQEQPDIRVAAAVALGQYALDRVFQGLVGALEAHELAINMAAWNSLVTLTGEDLGLEAGQWLRWYNGVEDPFAGRKEYLFPTYQRQETWLEKLAFWSSKSFEQPAPPAGLRPPPRRTYQDNETPADETGG